MDATELLQHELEVLATRTQNSKKLYEQIRTVVPRGVGSAFQYRAPYPIYMVDGSGARIRDVDGNEYADFHAGFGAMVAGHAHPALARNLHDFANRAIVLGAPTQDLLPVAEALRARFRLPSWTFTNSGTEATMGAVRLARAFTRRDQIIKVIGAYHGHHDSLLASVGTRVEHARHPSDPVAFSRGIPRQVLGLTSTVPYNDPAALKDRLHQYQGRVAGVIVEVPLCTPSVFLPEPGYCEDLRELTAEAGAMLILDEVKTGLVVSQGGSTTRFRMQPDIVTLAKPLAGGVPCGAIGGREDVMQLAQDQVPLPGTMNGSPLALAMARTMLEEILTRDAYKRMELLNHAIANEARRIASKWGLPISVVTCGGKGALMTTGYIPTHMEEWLRDNDATLGDLLWTYQINRGVYMSPSPQTRWTLTVAHSEADVARFTDNLADLAQALR